MASILDAIDHAAHELLAPIDGMTVGDLFDRFGPIPLWRIVRDPVPGTAALEDVLIHQERTGRFCELVDGVLVEKDLSYKASRIAIELAARILQFVKLSNLGLVTGEQGFIRLTTGRVRGPDVAFVAWGRLPGGREPREPVPNLAPTLAVEVISPGNTKREMDDKLDDYFRSGVELVWYVYPDREEVEIFTSPKEKAVLGRADVLDGGTALPGFTLSLAELFAEPVGG
ncbi:MAG: Uma2 family endonuclease [Planctomycetota bacterium]|nr:Uma2 family endonuclease [Planctomycetaceae bacterium]MDQ3331539.1 Uma2 family endonuclease [Planctomycetota bacterium]